MVNAGLDEVSAKSTPPFGAGAVRLIDNLSASWLGIRERGTPVTALTKVVRKLVTVDSAVALPNRVEVALMVEVPSVTPVINTLIEVTPAGAVAVAGTVSTAGLLLLSVRLVPPAGTSSEKLSVTFRLPMGTFTSVLQVMLALRTVMALVSLV